MKPGQVQVPTAILFFLIATSAISLASGRAACNITCDFYDWAKDAYCGFRNLSHIPTECDAAVLLDLRNNHIRNLPYGAFSSFSELRYVDISENGLSVITRGAFEGALDLRHIYLFENDLDSLHEGTFDGPNQLRQLYLSENRLHFISPLAFSNLTAMNILYLNRNNLTGIDGQIFARTVSLQYLHLSYNQLKHLAPLAFSNLRKLKFLDLTSNNIQSLPNGIFEQLTSLTTLKLANNQLVSLNFLNRGHFNILETLDVTNNSLKEIPLFDHQKTPLYAFHLAMNNLTCNCQFEHVRKWFHQQARSTWLEAAKCDSGKKVIELVQELCPTNQPPVTPSKEENLIFHNFASMTDQVLVKDSTIVVFPVLIVVSIILIAMCSCLLITGCFCYVWYSCTVRKEECCTSGPSEVKFGTKLNLNGECV